MFTVCLQSPAQCTNTVCSINHLFKEWIVAVLVEFFFLSFLLSGNYAVQIFEFLRTQTLARWSRICGDECTKCIISKIFTYRVLNIIMEHFKHIQKWREQYNNPLCTYHLASTVIFHLHLFPLPHCQIIIFCHHQVILKQIPDITLLYL